MSECCSACNQVIVETQERVKCAGPYGKVFHETCAREIEYRKTLGVRKDVNGGEKPFRLKLQSSPASVVTTDILNHRLEVFKQQLIDEFRGFVESFKSESEISSRDKQDTDITEIKKELSELRIQNEVFRTENIALAKQVKTLEMKVGRDSKIFDEIRKLMQKLSKNVDETSKNEVELKDGLRDVRKLNDKLESENTSLTVQVKELKVRVNGLERSIQNLTKRNEAASKVAAADRPAPREEENLLLCLQNLHLPLVTDLLLPSPLATTECNGLDRFSVSKPHNWPSVQALAGIGPVYGGRLEEMGYPTVAHLYKQFLALNKNRSLFQSWLNSVCGANSRWYEHCYSDLARLANNSK